MATEKNNIRGWLTRGRSINDLTKLSPAEVTAKAVEMATKMLDYETATYMSASFRKTPQSPDAAAPTGAGFVSQNAHTA